MDSSTRNGKKPRRKPPKGGWFWHYNQHFDTIAQHAQPLKIGGKEGKTPPVCLCCTVLSFLVRYADNDTGTVIVSQSRLAEMVKRSKRWVILALAELERLEIIENQARSNGKQRLDNCYRILPPNVQSEVDFTLEGVQSEVDFHPKRSGLPPKVKWTSQQEQDSSLKTLVQDPPPTPSTPDGVSGSGSAEGEGVSWTDVRGALDGLNVHDIRGVVDAAQEGGLTPEHVAGLIEHFGRLTGLKPGALVWRIKQGRPDQPASEGWPAAVTTDSPPSPEKQEARRRHNLAGLIVRRGRKAGWDEERITETLEGRGLSWDDTEKPD